MSRDYANLDQLIVQAIGRGQNSASKLSSELDQEARLHTNDLKRRPVFSVIDQRLQALKTKGTILFDRNSNVWVIRDAR